MGSIRKTTGIMRATSALAARSAICSRWLCRTSSTCLPMTSTKELPRSIEIARESQNRRTIGESICSLRRSSACARFTPAFISETIGRSAEWNSPLPFSLMRAKALDGLNPPPIKIANSSTTSGNSISMARRSRFRTRRNRRFADVTQSSRRNSS